MTPAACEKLATATLPIRLVSEANRRENHFAKARRVKQQRGLVRMLFKLPRDFPFPDHCTGVVITLTRVYGKRGKPFDAHDNLRSSFKAVVDQVAETLGVDDGDPRLDWQYEQQPGADYGVRIEIARLA